MNFEFSEQEQGQLGKSFVGAKIKVIGVGGGGCNAVNGMIQKNLAGVEFYVVNTDEQALDGYVCENKVQIGAKRTKGLGAGGEPKVGHEAATEDQEKIGSVLEGADMVFVTAGMGGGTGTGAAPVVAKAAREKEILVVGIVTKPFRWEGKPRSKKALAGIEELRKNVDTLIIIPNDKLIEKGEQRLNMRQAFEMANDVLYKGTRSISDIINLNGEINVDFADVRSVMLEGGDALMGSGSARGEGRAAIAAQAAISSPLLDNVNISGATGVLVNIMASEDLMLDETNEIMEIIENAAGDESNTYFGLVLDETLGDELKVTVIATGFNKDVRKTVTEIQPKKETASNLFQKQQQTVRVQPEAMPIFNPQNQDNGNGKTGNSKSDLYYPAYWREQGHVVRKLEAAS